MFDQHGKRIPEVHSPTPPPYSIAKEETTDEPEIIPTTEQLNAEALKLINKLQQQYPLLNQVFPGIPYKERYIYEEAADRTAQLQTIESLAEKTFPVNFSFTYQDARKAYHDKRGFCHHNKMYFQEYPNCDKCTEFDTILQSLHAEDYQKSF
jgi:hypothetical protein